MTECLWEKRGDLGILTIANPPQNSITGPVIIEPERLRALVSEPPVKGLVVAGAGKHFSAGADREALSDLMRDAERLARELKAGRQVLDVIASLEIPVIAAVRGACLGAGLEIALACHMRVCSENALFAFPEVNLGLMPGLGGTWRLPAAVGRGRATEMLLRGDIVSAEKALAMGLVEYVVPGREVLDFSLELLGKMTAERPLRVIKSIVRALANHGRLTPDEALEEETRLFCDLARDEAARSSR